MLADFAATHNYFRCNPNFTVSLSYELSLQKEAKLRD